MARQKTIKQIIETGEEITVSEASKISNVTNATIRNWCRDFGIGRRFAGKWLVDKNKLNKILKGEMYYDTRGKGRKRGLIKYISK